MSEKTEPINRKIARKIANQLMIAGYEDAAEYVMSDFMAIQINIVINETTND